MWKISFGVNILLNMYKFLHILFCELFDQTYSCVSGLEKGSYDFRDYLLVVLALFKLMKIIQV